MHFHGGKILLFQTDNFKNNGIFKNIFYIFSYPWLDIKLSWCKILIDKFLKSENTQNTITRLNKKMRMRGKLINGLSSY